jgi:hypothetical protein
MFQDDAVARSDPKDFFPLFLAKRSPRLFDPGTIEFILTPMLNSLVATFRELLVYFLQ